MATPTCPHGTPLVDHCWLNHDTPGRPTMRMRCLAEAIEFDPHSKGPQRIKDLYDWGDAAYAEWCWMIVTEGFIPTQAELIRARRRRYRRNWLSRTKWRLIRLWSRMTRPTF